jgi:hypothetical protein
MSLSKVDDCHFTLHFPNGKSIGLKKDQYEKYELFKVYADMTGNYSMFVTKYYKILRYIIRNDEFYFHHPNQLIRVFLTLSYYGNDELLERLKLQTQRRIWDFYDTVYKDQPDLQSHMIYERKEEEASKTAETWYSFRYIIPVKRPFAEWRRCVRNALLWYRSMKFPSFCDKWFYENLYDMF